ncbi:spore coat U domain-containing protein [Pseudomonas typographi]|uniref:Csu type fimbrial protein n=1 Tax=Pseudomonas typographi TaxID=2715964 RepID=UPI0016877492|nr:spore coat U domain-containing protein [Pseudomonas typographi]MBD1550303.1 spore coat U domain-containing protein [Pseudomonas typographi]
MSIKLISNVVAGSALGLGVMLSLNANAATTTADLAVTASVAAACTVTTVPLAFSTYTGTEVSGTADLTVTCTNGAPYTVGLGEGGGSNATTSTRALTNGADNVTLNYGLYQESSHSTNWGDVVGTDTVAGTGDGTAQPITVYGDIPAGQTTSTVGDYTDTVLVTINY